MEAGFEVVVEEMGVEPAELGELDQGIDRAGLFPIDEADRLAVAGDDVPVAQVAMADEARAGAEVAAEPGAQTASAGTTKLRLARWKSASIRPRLNSAVSSGQGPGCGEVPWMKLRVSRPSASKPPPMTRGAPAKPSFSRCLSRACTDLAQGPVWRCTTSPMRLTAVRPPPVRGISSGIRLRGGQGCRYDHGVMPAQAGTSVCPMAKGTEVPAFGDDRAGCSAD